MQYVFFGVMAVLWGLIVNRFEAGMKLILQLGWIMAWVVFLIRFYT